MTNKTKLIRNILLLTLLASLFNAPARAQMAYGPEGGDWEVTLTGSGSNDNDFDNGAFAVDGSVGFYFTPNIELSLRQSVTHSNFGDSNWSGATRLALDYHFDFGRWRPFIGGNIGGIYGDGVRDSGAGGLEAGLKYYVLEKTFLFGVFEHQWLFDSGNDSNGRFIYSIGIGFNF